MDNFGDYVEELEAPPIPAVTMFVSSTLEEFGGLRRLLQGLPGTLDVPVTMHNLDDEGPSTHRLEDRLVQVDEADLLLLLLDSELGSSPQGDNRSYAEIEYEAARRNGCDVLVFERVPPSHGQASQDLIDFRDQLRASHTVGTLDQLSDALNFETIRDRLHKWLVESGRTQHSGGLIALGDQFVVSSDRSWRDNRVGYLDCWVMGVPAPRAEAGTASLMERANDEWNEACAAFALRSSKVLHLHLSRAIDLRPLDGPARYWLARLLMTTAVDAGDWRQVLKHAEIATRVFDETGRDSSRAGLGHLVQAKAFRSLGKLEGSTTSIARALERLGWHSEPHLEACYLELVAGSDDVAADHLHDAFRCFPPSFAFAEGELAELDRGSAVHDRVRVRLLRRDPRAPQGYARLRDRRWTSHSQSRGKKRFNQVIARTARRQAEAGERSGNPAGGYWPRNHHRRWPGDSNRRPSHRATGGQAGW